jgi:cytochrome bd-type quinol oxidase subunit 1
MEQRLPPRMGVVTGIVMAFQFGTNWSVLAQTTGPIQGPFLGYEAFTAFMYGGIVVLPFVAAYTIGVYWVFRGKVDRGHG